MVESQTARVLIVENEIIIARELALFLKKAGYEVAGISQTYDQAMQAAHENRPDLALMDINLDGDRSGFEAAESLKVHYNVPSIFLTSLNDMESITKAKLVEPMGYLVKPVKPNDLPSAIEIALQNHRRQLELKGHVKQLTSAMDSIQNYVIIIDKVGNIDFANSRVQDSVGIREFEEKHYFVDDLMSIGGQKAWQFISQFPEKELLQDTIVINEAKLKGIGKVEVQLKGHLAAFHGTDNRIAGHIIVLSEPGRETGDDRRPEDIVTKIVDKFFFLKDKSSLYRISLDEVLYIEALGNYIKVHTSKKIYTVLLPMKEVERMLPAHKFFRCHRSFIVALERITAIHHAEVQINDQHIPIGKTYKDELLKRIQVI